MKSTNGVLIRLTYGISVSATRPGGDMRVPAGRYLGRRYAAGN